ncbi:methionine synthase reductase-like isoform X2 [Mya arenaria]|nr:methionine synthase reductase-like isoform X2 [Mya arenaria]
MPVSAGNRFLLLYGSQTGQAQAIAEEIAERSAAEGLQADMHCLSKTEKKFNIERIKCVVIVISTTGDGEPPDTALKFVRRLKKKTLKDNYLSGLKYTLLGLGDSNYTNFCNCGKTLDQRLQELGAGHLYSPGFADDAVGLEVVVEPWIEGLFPALRTFLNLPDPKGDGGGGGKKVGLNQDHEKTLDGEGRNTVNGVGETGFSTEKAKTIHREGETGVSPEKAKTVNGEGETGLSPEVAKLVNGESNFVETNITTDESANCSCADNVTKHSNSDQNSVNVTFGGSSGSDSQTDKTDHEISLSCDIPNSDPKASGDTEKKENGTQNVKVDDKPAGDSSVQHLNDSKNANCSSQFTQTKETCTGSGGDNLSSGVRLSVPPLSESTLTVPALPAEYLKVEFLPEQTCDVEQIPLQNGCAMPSAASPVTMATVVSINQLTHPTAVKKTLAVELDISDSGIEYQPGDAISVICPNDAKEVDMLLTRLGLEDKADTTMQITVLTATKKRNANVPSHVPPVCTPRHLLMTCLDIRQPPKKALLRVLVDHTKDPEQKRRLQELCSKQGMAHYSQYIREPELSPLDILNHFPSCTPPIEALIEHLPRLQPRPYSVCTSQRTTHSSLQFVFNIVEISAKQGRTYQRRGVCTGWLDSLRPQGRIQTAGSGDSKLSVSKVDDGDLLEKLEALKINHIKVPIFTRTNQHFRLPDDDTVPLILIGPGTGVAPFIGYLEERAWQRHNQSEVQYGDIYLFSGCRHKDRDYLFREQLEDFESSSVLTKLCVSFSRDIGQPEGSPRYVQDNIRAHDADLVSLIEGSGACICVCGDATNMAKDVNKAFVDIIAKEKGITEEEAGNLVMKLRLDRRYREDVWT